MALKDKWVDKRNNVDMVDADDINEIAAAVIDMEENGAGNPPIIGENGNWYIGGKDTGKPSRGEKGEKGDKGDKGDLGGTAPVVQIPGDSETQVMSQKATTEYVKDYIPKVATRNLLNVTWQNAIIDSGKFRTTSVRQDVVASPDYIAVTGGANYTFSCIKSSVRAVVYVHEYSDTNETAYIKTTRAGATNDSTMPSTIQLDGNCAYVRVHLYAPSAPTSWEELIPENFQMELGTVATSYVKPVVIDDEEIDDTALADRMRANGKIPNDGQYIDTLSSTEQLPVSAWEYGALSNDDGSETTTNPVEIRVRTNVFIQLCKGDTITSTREFDVFEYNPMDFSYIGGADGWVRSYTVQNDCFARIHVINPKSLDVGTIAESVTINHVNNNRIKFIALPLNDMRKWCEIIVDEKTAIGYVSEAKFAAVNNSLLKQVAHRGYVATGAPECTAPAYIAAKKHGFTGGENDLRVTSDGVLVMAHVAYIKSDKNVIIAENTYETLLTHNMGTFNGITVPIMTFEKWLILMKKIGLEAYIDIKPTLTDEQAEQAVAIVRKHGMLDNVTWCGKGNNLLLIRQYHPTARVAYLQTSAFSDADINNLVKPFVIEGKPDLTLVYNQSINITAEYVEKVYNAGIGVECWHCDYSSYGFTTEEAILAEVERVVDLGVTGICLDTYLPGVYFLEKLNAEWGLE